MIGIGEAVGTAAFIAAVHNRNLNDIDASEIRDIIGIGDNSFI